MPKRIVHILFILLLLISNKLSAQTDTLFWFAAPDLQQLHADRPIFLRVATTDNPALITITQPANPAFPTLSFFVAANSTQSYDLTPYIIQIENGCNFFYGYRTTMFSTGNISGCQNNSITVQTPICFKFRDFFVVP
jgi:hypothetical protein